MKLTNKQRLLEIFNAAIKAVNGQKLVADYLRQNPINEKELSVIAIGKAAASMMAGANQGLQNRIARGLVITKDGYVNPKLELAYIEYLEAGHPIPDQRSLDAGLKLLKFIHNTPQNSFCLFLMSGGTSSLVEVLNPVIFDESGLSILVEVLPEGLDIDDIEKVNNWLLGSGLAIHEMNVVRKLLSCIKGGRLASHFDGVNVQQLVLSDVIGDQLDVIGSGLLVADEHSGKQPAMPDWILDLINKAPPLPEKDDIAFDSIHSIILANNQTAMQSAKEKALSLGIEVFLNAEPLIGEIQVVADRLGQYIKTAQSGVHVFGGEPVVHLPKEPGRGGRMQTLALLLAKQIIDRDDVLVLCGATDGSDGSGEDAGALVDGKTISRGEIEEFDIDDCICRADAGSFLEASGDLIQTGPTGSNVNDLVFILKK
jgi:hydroxypyruvate reductase